MADPQIVTTLRAKRLDLERQLQALHNQVKAAEVALSHVSAVIQLYEVGDGPVAFPVHMDLSRLFKRGELWAMSKAALEAAGDPLTTRELAEHVMIGKGWNRDDKVLRQAVTYRVVQVLSIRWKRGLLASPGKRNGARLWASEV